MLWSRIGEQLEFDLSQAGFQDDSKVFHFLFGGFSKRNGLWGRDRAQNGVFDFYALLSELIAICGYCRDLIDHLHAFNDMSPGCVFPVELGLIADTNEKL